MSIQFCNFIDRIKVHNEKLKLENVPEEERYSRRTGGLAIAAFNRTLLEAAGDNLLEGSLSREYYELAISAIQKDLSYKNLYQILYIFLQQECSNE